MKKTITRMLCLMLALASLLTVSAFAAEDVRTGPSVRVNGKLIEFPDAQPFIDGNNRTLIPVRFVAETLGADVAWYGADQTVSIGKDDVLVEITIGDAELRVTERGVSRTVTMDTAAILDENRTYVPIRYVAEALGAYVDYSDTYRTVGIYSDVLTPEQITELMAMPYTQPDEVVGYETAKQRYDDSTLTYFYGTDRDSFQNFANAREHLYHMTSGENRDAFYADVVRKAVDIIRYTSEHMTVEYLADTSCIYQSDSMDRLTCAVRGIAVIRLNVGAQELEAKETAMLCALGFTQLSKGEMRTCVDVHVNTVSENSVTLHTIVPLGAKN
jgi:hypothetical protein